MNIMCDHFKTLCGYCGNHKREANIVWWKFPCFTTDKPASWTKVI